MQFWLCATSKTLEPHLQMTIAFKIFYIRERVSKHVLKTSLTEWVKTMIFDYIIHWLIDVNKEIWGEHFFADVTHDTSGGFCYCCSTDHSVPRGETDLAAIGIPCPLFSVLNTRTRSSTYNPFKELVPCNQKDIVDMPFSSRMCAKPRYNENPFQ